MPPLFFLFLLIAAASSDLSADRAALLAFRSAVSGRTLFWNATAPTPCGWSGVRCESNRVAALRLPASSLYGPLPPNTLSNITFLRTISLRLNHLSGPLPDLSRLSHLRNLYLQGNYFAGPIPDSIFSLHSLVKLNLASNNFSGEIPAGFNNMTTLRTLYLEENMFTGPLPDIDLPNLDLFNVSSNNLNGSVPESLAGKPKDAFLNTLLCGRPLDTVCAVNATLSPAPSTENRITNSRKKKLSGGAIDGIVIGSVAGLILLALIIFLLCRKRGGDKPKATRFADVGVIKNQPREAPTVEINAAAAGIGNGFPPVAPTTANGHSKPGPDAKKLVFFGNASRVFDLEELLRASAEVLGKGTFGTSYKAVLEMGTAVVVKRLKDVIVNESEFKERMEGVGRMDHDNLLPLRAYYYSREEKLLVSDYMPMGSLSALLHGNRGSGKTPLDWETRSGIALGVSRGLEHIHFQGPNISHGSIKSSNILLTSSHEARLSDFGLNPLVGPSSSPTRVAGYRAPEVTDPRRVSQKGDVYSFGVLLLELLTGKAPGQDDGVDLPRWVQSVVREEWTSEVFDVELVRGDSEEEMVQLLQVGIDCTAQFPDSRPAMSMVVARVEEIRRVTFRGDRGEHASEAE